MVTEWHVEGLYTHIGDEPIRDSDWDHLTTEDTKAEALAMAGVYDREEPQYPHRVRPYESD